MEDESQGTGAFAGSSPLEASGDKPISTARFALVCVSVIWLMGFAIVLVLGPKHGAIFKGVVWLLVAPSLATRVAEKLFGRRVTGSSVLEVTFGCWAGFLAWCGFMAAASIALDRTRLEAPEWVWLIFVSTLPFAMALGIREALLLRSAAARRFQRWTVRLLGLAMIVALVIPHLQPGPHLRARHVAGWGAVDCGEFRRDWDDSEKTDPEWLPSKVHASVHDCIATATRDRRAFFFSLHFPGIDSDLATGLVGTRDGLRRFRYDHMPCDLAPFCGTRFVLDSCRVEFGAAIDPNLACRPPAPEIKEESLNPVPTPPGLRD